MSWLLEKAEEMLNKLDEKTASAIEQTTKPSEEGEDFHKNDRQEERERHLNELHEIRGLHQLELQDMQVIIDSLESQNKALGQLVRDKEEESNGLRGLWEGEVKRLKLENLALIENVFCWFTRPKSLKLAGKKELDNENSEGDRAGLLSQIDDLTQQVGARDSEISFLLSQIPTSVGLPPKAWTNRLVDYSMPLLQSRNFIVKMLFWGYFITIHLLIVYLTFE